jgi:AbrB family looped-hinge helix DNA binding protein
LFWKGRCFGSVTVSEKGQIVIPAEARRKLAIGKGSKLLVFGRERQGVLVFIDADRVSHWIGRALNELTELSAALQQPKNGKGRRTTR